MLKRLGVLLGLSLSLIFASFYLYSSDMLTPLKALAFASVFVPTAYPSCIPDVPKSLLSEAAVLQHPAVLAALETVQQNLSSLAQTTGDGFSFAIVHASSPETVFTFNNGLLKMNETGGEAVSSDSIFRILSTSKNFAAFSTLVVENESRSATGMPLTLDTPVRTVLPNFGLAEADWENGGSEITLAMLGSHSSGLPREAYSTDFNMVTALAKVTSAGIGAEWAEVSPEKILEFLGTKSLMFAPGQRAAYSNAGFALLGYAAATYHNALKSTSKSWSQFMNEDVLGQLNMTHSFLGPIPSGLVSNIQVPAGENWADLVLNGYDPASGMWSSANDLAKYLHSEWLSPTPALITPTQQRQSLQPRLILPDGVQQVGFGWEIVVAKTVAGLASDVSNQSKTYNIYGKAGDGGGYHSWIDVVPNMGYGIVVLSAVANTTGTNLTTVSPTGVRDDIHEIVLPAFALALADQMEARFAGNYSDGTDTGLIADQVTTPNISSTAASQSYARLEVQNGVLFVRELVINGTSGLEAIDRLDWTDTYTGRFFSTANGASLNPSEGVGEAAQFGQGARVWRMIPEFATCDWFDFDGYTDQNGWALSKLVLIEKEDGTVALRYPPFDIELTRT